MQSLWQQDSPFRALQWLPVSPRRSGTCYQKRRQNRSLCRCSGGIHAGTWGWTQSKSPVPFPPSLPTFFRVTNCSMQESDNRWHAALLLFITEEGESSPQLLIIVWWRTLLLRGKIWTGQPSLLLIDDTADKKIAKNKCRSCALVAFYSSNTLCEEKAIYWVQKDDFCVFVCWCEPMIQLLYFS